MATVFNLNAKHKISRSHQSYGNLYHPVHMNYSEKIKKKPTQERFGRIGNIFDEFKWIRGIENINIFHNKKEENKNKN